MRADDFETGERHGEGHLPIKHAGLDVTWCGARRWTRATCVDTALVPHRDPGRAQRLPQNDEGPVETGPSEG
jgi:hypothetical protein